jgi:hypothetical protein
MAAAIMPPTVSIVAVDQIMERSIGYVPLILLRSRLKLAQPGTQALERLGALVRR